MPEQNDLPHDLTWYQNRWRELMDLLPASEPSDVVDQVRELQMGVLGEEAEALEEVGIADSDDAKAVLRRVFDRVQELRRENQTLHDLQDLLETDSSNGVVDSIEALQHRVEALEKQQSILHEAGFDHPEEVLQALESMEQQLNELYDEKEAAEQSTADSPLPTNGDTFDQLQSLLAREEKLQREVGASDPEIIATMIHDLTEQLESLYQSQERMSALGSDGIDHALSAIESTEDQLSDLYDASSPFDENGQAGTEDASRIQELEQQLSSLTSEKERLREKRDRLQARLDKVEETLGTGDPEAISALIQSLESQLREVYEKKSRAPNLHQDDDPLLTDAELSRIEDMDAEDLNELSAGLLCLDAGGVVQRANEQALQWPDLPVDTSDALAGTHFFDDLAPGTDNALFRGRCIDGLDVGTMDEQFSYTYVGARSTATNLRIHLHSKPNHPTHWIIFRVLEQY